MSRKFIVAAALLALLAFFIPIEHKYDKLFRFYALSIAPPGLSLATYDQKFYLYPSDIVALILLFFVPFRKLFAHPIWILFACAFLSILASPFATYLIPYSRLLQLFTPLLLFSFLRTFFNEEERQTATRWIFLALLFAALFQSGVAIAQYIHQGPIGLRLLSESQQFCTYSSGGGIRWIFDHFIDRSTAGTELIRAQGTMPHANPFGGFLFFTTLITYSLILKFPEKKRLLALTLPLQIFAMALSFSRSALFAWVIATFIWLALLIKNKEARFVGKWVLLSALLTLLILGEPFSNRGGIVNYNEAAQGSDHGRLVLQRTSLAIISDHPFLGVGYSLFSPHSALYLAPDAPDHVRLTAPHNIFLLLATETGLISLGAFLLTLWLTLRRLPLTLDTITLGSLLAGFLFIGLCDLYPLFYQQGKLMLFLTLGLLASHPKLCYKPSHV